MRLTWDEAKRIATPTHRGLDFADAAKVFDHFTAPDDRRDYGEIHHGGMVGPPLRGAAVDTP